MVGLRGGRLVDWKVELLVGSWVEWTAGWMAVQMAVRMADLMVESSEAR